MLKLFSFLFRYIYETLFMEGRDSDIIVSALNRDWKLHKLYLCQSPYFASMFNGNWRESNMDHIDITIVDPNISLDSMNVTLGKQIIMKLSQKLFLKLFTKLSTNLSPNLSPKLSMKLTLNSPRNCPRKLFQNMSMKLCQKLAGIKHGPYWYYLPLWIPKSVKIQWVTLGKKMTSKLSLILSPKFPRNCPRNCPRKCPRIVHEIVHEIIHEIVLGLDISIENLNYSQPQSDYFSQFCGSLVQCFTFLFPKSSKYLNYSRLFSLEWIDISGPD